MTYSFPCFTGDTLVLTNNGYKKISDVEVGEKVLTHKNTYDKVLASRCTGKKQIWEIKGLSIDKLKCTENHKFYVREMQKKENNIKTFSQPKWVSCCDLNKNHYLGIAINQNGKIPSIKLPERHEIITVMTKDGEKEKLKKISNTEFKLMNSKNFWWIVGRCLRKNPLASGNKTFLHGKPSEFDEMIPHLQKCNLHYVVNKNFSTPGNLKFVIHSDALVQILKLCGRRKEQRLPSLVLDMPVYLLQSFIEGYKSLYDCDTRVKAPSKKMAYGLAQIIAKVYKTPYRLFKSDPRWYIVDFTKKRNRAFYENGYIWYPIQLIKCTDEYEMVYDIEVENSHSFTANGTIAHNCTDLSVAFLEARSFMTE